MKNNNRGVIGIALIFVILMASATTWAVGNAVVRIPAWTKYKHDRAAAGTVTPVTGNGGNFVGGNSN